MKRTPKFIASKTARDTLMNGKRNLLLSSKETAGDIYLVEGVMPEGSEVPLHVHSLEDEIFHVLEGNVELRLGEEIIQASKGDIIYLPRDVSHGIKTLGSATARVLNYVVPGKNFENFFTEMNELNAESTKEERAQIAAKYGIEFL